MKNIKFMIRNMEAETEQTICVVSYFGKSTMMYATPLRIEPLFWDEKKECVKNSKYCTNKDEINGALKSIEAKINSFIAESTTKGELITKILSEIFSILISVKR